MRPRLRSRINYLMAGVWMLSALHVSLVAEPVEASDAERFTQQLHERLKSTATENSLADLAWTEGDIPRFSRFEAAFVVNATWDNPYDAEDIQVDGVLTSPSGQRFRVPAFYFEHWVPKNNLTQMMPTVYVGKETARNWRLRYAPTETGTYLFYLEVKTKQGVSFRSEAHSFHCVESAHPGYIQISRGNPRSFETSGDNQPWWGCGTNVAWTRIPEKGKPVQGYETYFGHAAGKMNATRVWLCHWAWLEWTDQEVYPKSFWRGYGGLRYYNQQVATAMDRLVELAEKYDLRIMLCTEDNNEHFKNDSNEGWNANPYNVINGGFCVEPQDFFHEPEAIRAYKNRLRYIMARWGYSTSLWVLNAWNDTNAPDKEVLAWLQTMSDYVHALGDAWRPVIYGTNYKFEANLISDYVQPEGHYPQNKPAVVQECYNVSDPVERFRPVLQDTLWEELADGMAAVMVWPHVVVEETDSWSVFTPPIRFAESLAMNQGQWEEVAVAIDDVSTGAEPPFERLTTAQSYGDVPVWGQGATRNRFAIDMGESSQWLEGIGPKLYGMRRSEWRNPPGFEVDFNRPGRILIEVMSFGERPQNLVVSIDGKEAGSFEYTGGRRYTNPDEHWVEVPIPAGSHTIKVENTGDDWIAIRQYCFTEETDSPADLIKASGQMTRDRGFAYLTNITDGMVYRDVMKRQPVTFQDLVLRIPQVRKGTYKVDFVDTGSGDTVQSQTVTATDTGLPIRIPSLKHDIAIKWFVAGHELARETEQKPTSSPSEATTDKNI